MQGTVQGSIAAGDRIELTATAKVNGGLTAARVVIADGANFNGSVYMGRRTIARRVAQHRAKQMAARPRPRPSAHFLRILSMALPLASSSTSLSKYRICCMSVSSISSTR